MNILYLYSQPRTKFEKAIKSMKMPDQVLFGLNHLKKLGHSATYLDTGFSSLNLLKWPMSPVQTHFMRHLGVGFQLDQALALLPQLKRADLIITTNDSCGLPVAALKKLGIVKTPQIYFHINFRSLKHKKLKQLTYSLLKEPEKIICFSPNTLKSFKPHFIAPPVDTQFFKPQKASIKYDLLAVGRDLDRDYKTLFKAINNLDLKALLICDPKNILNLNLPNNLEVKFSLPYLQVKKYYHQSKIIVIPTNKDSVSGQINLLESLACNKPVLAASTPSLNKILPSPPCTFYQPENPQDLKRKVNLMLNKKIKPNSRKAVLPLSSKHFAKKLKKIISSL